MELDLKHRPKNLDEVVGQPQAVSILRKMVKDSRIPHAVGYIGPSGTGKTTLARIQMSHLDCSEHDFHEINAADHNGIAVIRDIANKMHYRPFGKGKSRAWLFDEAHLLTPEAQNGLLKIVEEPPKHVYFIFATTHPQKLIPTLRGRLTVIELKPVGEKDLRELIDRIAKREKPKIPLSKAVVDKLVEKADNCPRKIAKDLGKVLPLLKEDERLDAISSVVEEKEVSDLLKLVFNFKKKPTWPELAKCLKSMTAEPETVRRALMGYAAAILLNGSYNKLAMAVIEVMQDDLYHGGQPALVARLCELFASK